MLSSFAEANFETFVSDLVMKAKYFERKLPKTIDVYSYTTRENAKLPAFGHIEPNDPRLVRFAQQKSEVFWNLEKQIMSGVDSDALYFANDPVASREHFGKASWLLFRARLIKETSYLDVEALSDAYLGDSYEPFRLQLAELGCDPDSAKSLRHLLMKNISIECRTIALEVLRRLSVQLFSYEWTAVNFKNCPNRGRQAFVMTNAEGFSQETIQGFTAEVVTDALSIERKMIEALFHQVTGPAVELGSTQLFNIEKKFFPWPQFDAELEDLDVSA